MPRANSSKPSLASVTAAAAGAAKTMPDDFRVSITNAPGKGAYPISSFTWLLVPEQDRRSRRRRRPSPDFLAWMLKDGQTMTEALSLRAASQGSGRQRGQGNR